MKQGRVRKFRSKGKEGEPLDKLPPPDDIEDDGADDPVPEEPEEIIE